MFALTWTIIGGIIFSLCLFAMAKFFDAKKKGGSATGGLAAVEAELSQLSQLIDRGFKHSQAMIPLEQLQDRENELALLKQNLAEEQDKVKKLDQQVEKLQKKVETEESAHNALKKGRDEAAELVDDLRSKHENLKGEQKKLQDELSASLSELNALSGEVELTQEQKAALDNVYSSLEGSQQQMASLADVYTQAYTRFTNLEGQYAELEREFTKLVEKELGNG